MRSSRFFWGIVVIALGVLFLLQTMGVLSFNAWEIFWPALLILAGLWVLFGRYIFRKDLETRAESVPLESSSEAAIELNHGAGKLLVNAGAAAGNLLDGTFVGGVTKEVSRQGFLARVKLSANVVAPMGVPWGVGSEGITWDVRLNPDLPLDLTFHTGAGETQADLSGLRVRSLRLETGASSSRITLPARAGSSSVHIQAGAASVSLNVPEGVAARIHVKGGAFGSRINTARFTQVGDVYESPDFASAANRVEIFAEGGMGSLDVN